MRLFYCYLYTKMCSSGVDNSNSGVTLNRTVSASDVQKLEDTLAALIKSLEGHAELAAYVDALKALSASLDAAVKSGTVDVGLFKQIQNFATNALSNPAIQADPTLKAALAALKSSAYDVYCSLLFKGGVDQIIKDFYGDDPQAYGQSLQVLFLMLDRTDILHQINAQTLKEIQDLNAKMALCSQYQAQISALKSADNKTPIPDDVKNFLANMVPPVPIPDGFSQDKPNSAGYDIINQCLTSASQTLMSNTQQKMSEAQISAQEIQTAMEAAANTLKKDNDIIMAIEQNYRG